MSDAINITEAGTLYELLQQARTELRHQAHIYVGTKNKDKFARDRAAESLENAAITVALLAAQWGIRAGCARPAGQAGQDWEDRIDPENALAKKRKRE
jgi:hypothetical protein